MRRTITYALLALLLLPAPPARAYTLLYTDASAAVQVRWPSATINVALSASLNSPPANIEATPADVVAAARRALRTWSENSNVVFNITTTSRVALDPTDGESVITVAQSNATQFSQGQQGRARISYNAAGQILEGDVALNPNVRFSTDGRDGTFDLETAFLHQIGHLLGLEHSGVVGAVMQPRQAPNGALGLRSLTGRTLASDDRAAVRALYGPHFDTGSISGVVTYAAGQPAFGAHVWAEDTATGRVVAGNVALANGSYRIDNLPPATYRVVAEYLNEPVSAAEIGAGDETGRASAYAGLRGPTTPFQTKEVGTFTVASANVTASFTVGSTPFLNPAFVGLGSTGRLASVPAPLAPGRTTTVLVGGDNVNTAVAGSVTVTSPLMHVSNVQDLGFFQNPTGPSVRVISLDVAVDSDAPPGEYSVRLQNSTEVSYVSGGLVIDLPNGVTTGNVIDDPVFFVAQHYRDFLNREPDQPGLDFWVNQTTNCGNPDPLVCRINVSAAFFQSIEFQQTGYLVYKTYGAAFGTRRVGSTVPLRFEEFLPDTQRIGRGVIVNQGDWQALLEANKVAFFNEFVARPQFTAAYPQTMSAAQFVDALNANAGNVLTQAERDDLVNRLGAGQLTRAQVLRAVAENDTFTAREKNRAFVLMQYFGYLRRNPSDAPEPTLDFTGFNFWLGKLNQFGGNFIAAEMVKGFITSTEYRARFGTP